jgi:hypothetical protein
VKKVRLSLTNKDRQVERRREVQRREDQLSLMEEDKQAKSKELRSEQIWRKVQTGQE